MSDAKRIRIKKNVLLLPDLENRVSRRWRTMEFGTSYSEALCDLIERGLRQWETEHGQQRESTAA